MYPVIHTSVFCYNLVAIFVQTLLICENKPAQSSSKERELTTLWSCEDSVLPLLQSCSSVLKSHLSLISGTLDLRVSVTRLRRYAMPVRNFATTNVTGISRSFRVELRRRFVGRKCAEIAGLWTPMYADVEGISTAWIDVPSWGALWCFEAWKPWLQLTQSQFSKFTMKHGRETN